ncbi:hypothetical protein U9M48_017891 [Paspalum notatum var. saurae]|uniref:Reverse transcriptase domain-containing protein n=1 Tax=Paspalum notatum var. saurae TaxID=547442 RepID=A0AAQ3T8S3_PASNO
MPAGPAALFRGFEQILSAEPAGHTPTDPRRECCQSGGPPLLLRPGASLPAFHRPHTSPRRSRSVIVWQLISSLIDLDQTGFMKGRSISENFVYATELVQCCYRHRCATLVLKLDFAKAFDSVEWSSLVNILRARGFPDLWCCWMEKLLCTSQVGDPGEWATRAMDILQKGAWARGCPITVSVPPGRGCAATVDQERWRS